MSWLNDLFSGSSSGPTLNGPGSYPWDPQQGGAVGAQPPQWANTLQLLGATLKDVGSQGRSNNVGATSQALQQHQQFVMQALARQKAAQAFGGGDGFSSAPPTTDSIKSTLMGLIQAGIDPTPYLSVAKFGEVSPEQQRLSRRTKKRRGKRTSKSWIKAAMPLMSR